MCPNCNEIPSFDQFPDGQLPPEYWSSHEGHWFAVLCQPSHDAIVIEQEPILLARSLVFDFVELEGPLDESVRIGGAPYWLQDPEVYRCCCGGEMTFVAQISENLPFPKQPAAPQQKDSFSADDYCLFLGNEVYIFACQRQCDPRAVWITVQG